MLEFPMMEKMQPSHHPKQPEAKENKMNLDIEKERFFRFHRPHIHLNSVFGDDWFAVKLMELLEENTRLTEITQKLSERIESLTVELREKILKKVGIDKSHVQ